MAPGQKDMHCTGGPLQMCLLDWPGQSSPRAEDKSAEAMKFWLVFQAEEAISPGGALLNSCRSASSLKAGTAPSRGGLSTLDPTNKGQKESVLALPE